MLKIRQLLAASIIALTSNTLFAVETISMPVSASKQWAEITQESQAFIAPAGTIVRYGIFNKYATRKILSKGIINCNNDTFGDPVPFTKKACYVDKLLPETHLIESPSKLADEHATLRVPAGSMVRYGADQRWIARVVGDKSVCNNEYFGSDPAPSVLKACYKNGNDQDYLSPTATLTTYSETPYTSEIPRIQLNVAGAEFTPNELPGKENIHYVFPSETYLDIWQKNGLKVIRFPILWERLQPVANKSFDSAYAQRIDKLLDQASQRSMGVIIDIHNYGRYYGKLIGSNDLPVSAYENLMQRVSSRWGSNPGLYGYDLMNEPYGDADKYWKKNAQAGINGIRMYDSSHPIYVEGRTWSNASLFSALNADLLALSDPSDNLIYSAHLYLDEGSSGKYENKIDDSFDPLIGVNRVKPFVDWLKLNRKRGHIGEFGVPGDDPRWLLSMNNLMTYLHENCIPLAYWAAGSWWSNYPLSVEPKNGAMASQWAILEKWIKEPNNKCL